MTGVLRCAGEPTCHSSRQFHAGIGAVARNCSGSPAGKRRFAFRIGRPRQPRRRRWSPEEVAQIFFVEPSPLKGKWPEPFIDGDDHRSCRVHDQVWSAGFSALAEVETIPVSIPMFQPERVTRRVWMGVPSRLSG